MKDQQMITQNQVRQWMSLYHQNINANADELNRLDAAIGDGDFGASMQRGLDAVAIALDELEDNTIGGLLRTTGSTIVSAIGGTSGPLVGSLFLKAGMKIGDVEECSLAQLAEGLQAGAQGIMDLGGAAPGDKTMIDALVPAVEALTKASEAGDDLETAVKKAAIAAADGAEATKELVARRGRASYTGDGGQDSLDAGAQGMNILFTALETTVISS